MSKTSLGKYKRLSKNSKLYKKVRKEYIQEAISLLSLPANSDALTQMLLRVRQVIFAPLVGQLVKKNLELPVVLLMVDEIQDDGKM